MSAAQEGELAAMLDRLASSMVASMKREPGTAAGPASPSNVTSGSAGSEQQLVDEVCKAVQTESVRHARRSGKTRPAATLITVYVSIGNSDDKLTQAQWSAFWGQVNTAVRDRARQVFGDWLSAPSAPYQNACIAFAVEPDDAARLKQELGALAADHEQDSIAWAEVQATEFIGPGYAET